MARPFWSVVVLLPIGFSLGTLRGLPQGPQPSAAILETFNGCGMEGDAKKPAMQALNRLKNRYTAPGPGEINSAVTLAAILALGNDVGRWKVKYGAEIVGYVHDVKPGPVESVNYGAHQVAERDTHHIELLLNPMDSSATRRVIVEVTPRWRAIMAAQEVDWSTRVLPDHFLGRWVRVRGWMLFDAEHKGEAENTAPGRPRNWRATAWEVHPVTSFEVVPRPR